MGNLLYRIRRHKLLRCRLVLCTHRVAINSFFPCAAVGIEGDGYDIRLPICLEDDRSATRNVFHGGRRIYRVCAVILSPIIKYKTISRCSCYVVQRRCYITGSEILSIGILKGEYLNSALTSDSALLSICALELHQRLILVGDAVTAGKRIVLIVPCIQIIIQMNLSIILVQNSVVCHRGSNIIIHDFGFRRQINIRLIIILLILLQLGRNQIRNLRASRCRFRKFIIELCILLAIGTDIMLVNGVIQLFCRLSSVFPDSIQSASSLSEFFQLGCLGAQCQQAQRLCSICANAPAYKLFSSIRRIRGNLLYRIRRLIRLRCLSLVGIQLVVSNICICCPFAAVGIKGDGYIIRRPLCGKGYIVFRHGEGRLIILHLNIGIGGRPTVEGIALTGRNIGRNHLLRASENTGNLSRNRHIAYSVCGARCIRDLVLGFAVVRLSIVVFVLCPNRIEGSKHASSRRTCCKNTSLICIFLRGHRILYLSSAKAKQNSLILFQRIARCRNIECRSIYTNLSGRNRSLAAVIVILHTTERCFTGFACCNCGFIQIQTGAGVRINFDSFILCQLCQIRRNRELNHQFLTERTVRLFSFRHKVLGIVITRNRYGLTIDVNSCAGRFCRNVPAAICLAVLSINLNVSGIVRQIEVLRHGVLHNCLRIQLCIYRRIDILRNLGKYIIQTCRIRCGQIVIGIRTLEVLGDFPTKVSSPHKCLIISLQTNIIGACIISRQIIQKSVSGRNIASIDVTYSQKTTIRPIRADCTITVLLKTRSTIELIRISTAKNTNRVNFGQLIL